MKKNTTKNITIKLNKEVFKELVIEAIKKDTTIHQLLNKYIKEMIKEEKTICEVYDSDNVNTLISPLKFKQIGTTANISGLYFLDSDGNLINYQHKGNSNDTKTK